MLLCMKRYLVVLHTYESYHAERSRNVSAYLYLRAAIVCNMPPTTLQIRMSQGHAPPCRLRACILVTVANHFAVAGRLKRQVMSGEKIRRMTLVTTGQ